MAINIEKAWLGNITLGGQKVEEMESWSFDNSSSIPTETLTFEGTFDPDGEPWESLEAKLGKEFIGIITLESGEKREVLLRGSCKDGIVTVEPVNAEDRDWIKKGYGW
jgi:hypothetical protein